LIENLKTERFKTWDKYLRSAAKSDNYALFRNYVNKIGLSTEPKLMLNATIRLVEAISIYANLDGIQFDEFMNMQLYNPIEASNACYCFTFDIYGKACARVLADSNLILPDLADLYNHPWVDYDVVGYQSVRISHPDWSCLNSRDIKLLEDEVSDDLRFDYSEDELDFWFEIASDASFLVVNLQDIEYTEEAIR